MRKKFCPKCGKITEKFYKNLCRDCFLEKVSVKEEIPSKIVIKRCKLCGKFYVKKRAVESLENSIDTILSELLEQPEIHSATYRIENKNVHINLTLKILGLEKKEEKVSSLIIKNIICKACSMRSTGYYQALLQIRLPKNLKDIVLKEVKTQIDFLNKYDRLAFISKLDKKPKGVDIYIGSKSSAMQIARYLKSRFKAKIKISRKLSGSIRGKRVYRDTILVSIGD
jgi:nonsense-mediated mRNA decay protein 3